MDGARQLTDSALITPQPDGTFNLELGGAFPPEWVGALCAGLSVRRINVERAFAKQVQRGAWDSMFVLRPFDASTRMEQVNYRELALAPKKQAVAMGRPVISSFKMENQGDSVSVSIRAPDELGLLGRLLGSFSFLMLFVHEMRIQTVGREAQDTFVLKGLAGMAPGDDTRARLLAALQAMSTG